MPFSGMSVNPGSSTLHQLSGAADVVDMAVCQQNVLDAVRCAAERRDELEQRLRAASNSRVNDPGIFPQHYIAENETIDDSVRANGHLKGDSQGVDAWRKLHCLYAT